MNKYVFTILLLLAFFYPMGEVLAATPIKILIVPGHDDISWGAQYKNIKEADMNLRLANEIYNLLKKDARFKVSITRNWDGYLPVFASYFEKEKNEIQKFIANSKQVNQFKIDTGDLVPKSGVPHNTASQRGAEILYSLNAWADSHAMDLVLHVHFNDYPRETPWAMGKYKGFAVYYPEAQMVNSSRSLPLAKTIFTQLKKKYATSTYPKETGGLIPDQNLIALGSNETLYPEVRSVLVEYGYIYRFGDSAMRHKFYKDAATLTTAGIRKYFFPK